MVVVISKHTLFGQNQSHEFSTTLQLGTSPGAVLCTYLKGQVPEGLRYSAVGCCVAVFITGCRISTNIMPLSEGVGFLKEVE